ETLAGDLQTALGQIVLQVTVPQIETVVGRGHAGRIRIPEQQIERQRLLAFLIDVDDVRPDEIVRAQQIEDRRHLAGIEIALSMHLALDFRDLLLVGEDLEVAGVLEIDLGGEKGRAANSLVARSSHGGERGREKRAADAIADGVDALLAGRLAHGIYSSKNSLALVDFEGHTREKLVRVCTG